MWNSVKYFGKIHTILWQRITEWLRLAFLGPSAPAPAPKGHPEQGAQDHIQVAFEDPQQDRDPTASGQPVPVLCHCAAQKCSWCSEGTSCALICAHGLWSCHGAPLTEPGSDLLAPPMQKLLMQARESYLCRGRWFWSWSNSKNRLQQMNFCRITLWVIFPTEQQITLQPPPWGTDLCYFYYK